MLRENNFQPAATPATPGWSPVTHSLGLDALFDHFAEGAAARDVSRTPIFAETDALKARGFGALRLVDGPDAAPLPLPAFFAVIRDLATADSNIAHVFRNHFFAVESHRLTPQDPFSGRVLSLALNGAMFGIAFSEGTADPAGGVGYRPSAVLDWDGADYRISGTKIYSTGNLYADHLFGTAIDSQTDEARQFFIPTRAPGVVLEDDWDGFGQKLTGSGKTVFDRVVVAADDIHTLPARNTAEPFLYGFTFHQVYLTTIIAGITTRILRDAIALVQGRSRNFYHAIADHPRHEPPLQSVIGRIAAHRAAILAVTERAVDALDRAWAGAKGPTAADLSVAASIAAAEAKVVADETAATLASLLIDVASGSGVSASRALDRHWRNIKVISSHNPRVYKERVLGDHYLNGTLPPTGAFF